MTADDDSIERQGEQFASIAEIVEYQLAGSAPQSEFDPASLIRFSPRPARQPRRRGAAGAGTARAELEPWLQGPFLVGGDLVVGGAWRTDSRWEMLGDEVPDSLAGMRVLDVGSNAGYDPFRFSLRGPEWLLACEPFAFIEQMRFLEEIYETGIEIRQSGWQCARRRARRPLRPRSLPRRPLPRGRPWGCWKRLFEMTAPGGLCIFGSMMHGDPELADLSRLCPSPTSATTPGGGRPARWRCAGCSNPVGFRVEKTFGVSDGPPGEFPTINGNFRCVRPA